MLEKEKFKEIALNTFGDDVSSERLDMMYKNYLFNELGRNQIYGVTGGTNLEFSSYEEAIKIKLNSIYGKDVIENKPEPLYSWIKWINNIDN